MKKILLVSVLAIITFACGEKEKKKAHAPTPVASADAVDGAKVYKISCAVCHGDDGKLGANGSKDITQSTLPLEERIAQITNGKGLMPAQKDILTAAEIKAAAEYSMTLK